MPAIPGGSDAVEQIDPSRNSLQKIGWKANSHKITGDFYGEGRPQVLQDAVHHRLRLAHRQTSDGDAGPGSSVQRALERAHPELIIDAALNNRPECLAERWNGRTVE